MAEAAQDPGPTAIANVISKIITQHAIPLRIYIPFGKGPFPVISYYHGGGFVLMGLEGESALLEASSFLKSSLND